ncbi:cupin domain-containing protein [Halalkalibacter sp. AB-rgal2]|uniref:cupin domain-containing protein n=1 Tax=Halalkalibacter sp. AB-rgal2 TaxID=3242695 RepID=UPI00359E2AA7
MYYDSSRYPYPYFTPVHQMDSSLHRNVNNDETNILLASIQQEASMMNLYKQLADATIHSEERRSLLEVVENKQYHVNQLTNHYMSHTGKKPEYTVENVSFERYEEGLLTAYNKEKANGEQYERNASTLTNNNLKQTLLSISKRNEEVATYFRNIEPSTYVRRTDYGSEPFVIDIEKATKRNNYFRTALWTGEYLQLTLMSIQPGDDIGLEIHHDHDQFLRIEDGRGRVQMGRRRQQLDFERNVKDDDAIFIPAGTWHNVTNTGRKPLKLYSIYAPPEHPRGTVHETKAVALEAEANHS